MPAIAVVSRNEILAEPQLLIRATPGELSVNGTLTDVPIESTLQDGTSTLTITARGDRWVDAFGEPGSPEGRLAAETLVRGLSSYGATNLSAWDRAVTPVLLGLSDVTNFTSVVISLVSNETVELALPRVPAYDVLLPEPVDLRVDASLLMSNTSLALPTAVVIVPTPGSATLSGNALTNLTEFEIAFNRTVLDLRIEILLKADTWQDWVGTDPASTLAILRGIQSSGTEQYGWNNVVSPAFTLADAEKVSSTELLTD